MLVRYGVLVLAFFVLAMPLVGAQEYRIGVSPLVINAGDMEPGTSKVLGFNVITPSNEEILINLGVGPGTASFFNKPEYKELKENFSEEDITSWINVLNNPILLKPSEEIHTGQGTIRGYRTVNFILEVPQDAEPGVRVAKIIPSPSLVSGQGNGVNLVTIVSMSLLVNVPGEVVRSGEILDVTKGLYDGKRAELNTIFKNTGTVTVNAQAQPVLVYDEERNEISRTYSVIETVKPGEIQLFRTFINAEEFENGPHRVKSTVIFEGGEVEKESIIALAKDQITGRAIASSDQPFQIPFPAIIVIVIIAVIIVLYRRRSQ